MIVFNLKCAGGHGFEEWFASSDDYEAKLAAHAIACPECGGTEVIKGISAPRVNGGAAAAAEVGPCGMPCGPGMCQMMS
jgi:hypothetical protein